MTDLLDIESLYDLTGRVAIVSGGAEGMGAEIVRFLASAGATVALADIKLELAETTAAAIRAAGGQATAYGFDLAQEESVIAMVQAVRADLGGLDILVNVAGLQDRELLEETTTAFWDRMHAVNLRGPFLTIREAAKVMRADKTAGRIINISSVGSVHPILHGLVAYNASKAGVNGLTRNAAYELAGDGITVNAVLPGSVATEGQARATGPAYTEGAPTRGVPPLGRKGLKSDIANAVLFFASPGAEWVTGQTLIVDGGALIR